ncbi:MAG: sigma-70 factor domain-containing protein, partial [Nitrospirota bacterium]|nr:sigma-70 factor domain-containing protein [Nitrospirota bacterium]
MPPSVSAQKSSWNGTIKRGKTPTGQAMRLPKSNQVREGAAGMPDRQLPLYLKEIGQVMLLDREGEVKLCKKIEEANDQMLEVLFVLPITMEFLKDQRMRLSQGEILAKHLVQKNKEVVLDGEGEAEQAELQNPQEDEEFRQQVIQQLGHLCQ